MMKPLVVVTGKNGQLGWELQQLASSYENSYRFVFADRDSLNLQMPETIVPFLAELQPRYIINCAAYTAVDKAETEQEQALMINATAVGTMAAFCEKNNCKFITVSTDYVFNGNGTSPYKTGTPTEPVNYYGYSKMAGEQLAQENNPSSVIVRTSWVYSAHGNNFVKTMLRLMKERDELKVVGDQVGSPTYAADLAQALMQIIEEDQQGNCHSGIYHFSNTGVISWFDFATAIREYAGFPVNLVAVPSTEYPTPAKRPAYSVMDTASFSNHFNVKLQHWKLSLHRCMDLLQMKNKYS